MYGSSFCVIRQLQTVWFLAHPVHVRVCVCVQCKEDAMMSRIKDAENAQTVAEMKQRIADLEIQVSLSAGSVCQ